MFLEGNNGEMEFLVNRAALFLVVGMSLWPPASTGGSGLTLVDFGFMSHSSMDAAGGTTPLPIPRPGPLIPALGWVGLVTFAKSQN